MTINDNPEIDSELNRQISEAYQAAKEDPKIQATRRFFDIAFDKERDMHAPLSSGQASQSMSSSPAEAVDRILYSFRDSSTNHTRRIELAEEAEQRKKKWVKDNFSKKLPSEELKEADAEGTALAKTCWVQVSTSMQKTEEDYFYTLRLREGTWNRHLREEVLGKLKKDFDENGKNFERDTLKTLVDCVIQGSETSKAAPPPVRTGEARRPGTKPGVSIFDQKRPRKPPGYGRRKS